jgi:hypothetical protein
VDRFGLVGTHSTRDGRRCAADGPGVRRFATNGSHHRSVELDNGVIGSAAHRCPVQLRDRGHLCVVGAYLGSGQHDAVRALEEMMHLTAGGAHAHPYSRKICGQCDDLQWRMSSCA